MPKGQVCSSIWLARTRKPSRDSSARAEATSPALWPPMPSATANRPSGASTSMPSSLWRRTLPRVRCAVPSHHPATLRRARSHYTNSASGRRNPHVDAPLHPRRTDSPARAHPRRHYRRARQHLRSHASRIPASRAGTPVSASTAIAACSPTSVVETAPSSTANKSPKRRSHPGDAVVLGRFPLRVETDAAASNDPQRRALAHRVGPDGGPASGRRHRDDEPAFARGASRSGCCCS